MLEREAEDRAREMCLRWLEAAPRTRRQLADRLRQKDVDEAAAGRALDRLQAAGLIDDEAYARNWIRAHAPEGAMGRRRLAAELARRGVPRETADRVLADEAPPDEGRAAETVAARQAVRYRGLPREAARRRLAGFLSRRGFVPEEVFRAVDRVLPRKEE